MSSGSGVGLEGAGLRVQGAGFRVQVAGCRVQGAGCRGSEGKAPGCPPGRTPDDTAGVQSTLSGRVNLRQR